MWMPRNVYLRKIKAKSFRDGSKHIWKDTESNLGPFAASKGEIIQKQALFSFRSMIIALCLLFFLPFSFLARQVHIFA